MPAAVLCSQPVLCQGQGCLALELRTGQHRQGTTVEKLPADMKLVPAGVEAADGRAAHKQQAGPDRWRRNAALSGGCRGLEEVEDKVHDAERDVRRHRSSAGLLLWVRWRAGGGELGGMEGRGR